MFLLKFLKIKLPLTLITTFLCATSLFAQGASSNDAASVANGKKATLSLSNEQERRWALMGGSGYNSNMSIIGIEGRRLLDQQLYLSGGATIVAPSPSVSAGFGWQNKSSSATCFFYFDCTKRFILQSSFIFYPSGTLTIDEHGGRAH